MAQEGFGPSALLTPANAVTIGRLLATPVLLVVVVAGGRSWPAVALWIILASTDGLDGYLARRHGSTRSGAYLDPLADKCLVLGALAALVVIGAFWWLPVSLIAAREAAISGYRTLASRQGLSVPARPWAKVKTVVQEVAVGLALAPFAAAEAASVVVIWAAVVLTLGTGVQYLADSRKPVAR